MLLVLAAGCVCVCVCVSMACLFGMCVAMCWGVLSSPPTYPSQLPSLGLAGTDVLLPLCIGREILDLNLQSLHVSGGCPSMRWE